MKFTSTKQTLIGFTVFLTILFLGSCSVADDTAPPNNPPQPDYMSFTLTNLGGGLLVNPTNELSRGDSYRLIITPTNGTTIPTADYTITHTPTDAITTNVIRTNSVDFTVQNTADRTFRFTVTHRTVSSISETVTLNLAPQDYMSFVLTNRSGATVATTTELSRGSTYGLVITPVSGVMPATADYTIAYTPATAITTNVIRTNSVDFTVNNITDRTVTISVVHRSNSAVSETITLNLPNQIATSFQQDIENAVTMPYMATANALTREVLEPLGATAGATLVKRYVTESGGTTTRDGTSWATAWAAANLRSSIDAISDASVSRVYLVMIAGGTYKPTTTTTRTVSFRMNNYVAIMGGFQTGGGWGRTGTTVFSGDIGTAGDTNDNSYNVFSHDSISLGNAHLYGVTITDGNANGGASPQNQGGGMYNSGSSPMLTRVVFSGNIATTGGGMYNRASSPVLTRVVFSGNTATGTGVFGGGGGMVNVNSSPVLTEIIFNNNNSSIWGGGMLNTLSSLVLTEVVLSGNTAAGNGGGMFNNTSSLVLTRVVFSGNTATGSRGGGGMYNVTSSPVIIGAVFTNNRAANGGAMYNDTGGGSGPLIVNTIFSGNTLSGGGRGTNIVMDHGNAPGAETIRIAGSVLGMGLTQPINAIVGYNGSGSINITYRSLANTAVNFGADATFTVNGMNFPYPTITGGSAVNLGLHVRRSGTTYYFSEDNATWYTSFSATGGWGSTGNPPANAEDLTATDIAGNPRVGRPDAGVYEVR